MTTAVSLDALTAVSVVYFARTIERSADAYGVIGVSFVFVGWLFSAALVLIGARVVGAALSSGPTRANDRASLYSRLLARSKRDRDAAGG